MLKSIHFINFSNMAHKQDPTFTYQGKKFPHDLTHNLKFTTSTGQLIPVLADILYPSDHVKIKPVLFTRMADLETAAFTRLREHIEYFFVPLNQIISSFPQFIYGVGKNNSSLIDASGLPGIPILDSSVDYGPMVTGADMFGVSQPRNAYRLLDMLGYSKDPATNVFSTNGFGVNVLPICAYHKVFYDHYAIQDRTNINPYLWNLDDSVSSGFVQFGSNTRPAGDFFGMHYRPYMHDYFTDMKVSPLESQSSMNANANLNGRVNNWLSNNSAFSAVNPSGNTGQDDRTTVSYYDSSNNLQQKQFTTANIRAMFAVDKLLEITRRSKKDYAHQTLAHFGTNVNEGISGRAYKIGSVTQDLVIQDVDATASSDVGSGGLASFLGQQGGKGVTTVQSDRMVDFTAPCHGILIGIYSAEPIIDYPDNMLNRLWTYHYRYDFFTPEFDHLGMQPVFGYEINASDMQRRGNVMGWQYRYQESKQRFNRITTGFNTPGLSAWNTVRNQLEFGNTENAFYISPYYLDPIMLVGFDMDDQGTDPLRHSLDQIYYKSSVMSNFSLPQLTGNN